MDNDFKSYSFEEIISPQQALTSYENFKKSFNHAEYSLPTHRVHFLKTAWFRYPPSRIALRWASAAAIILLVTSLAVYYTIFYTSSSENKIVQTLPSSIPDDILPGSDRAILTLSNGDKLQLNNATSETIKDGNLAIENNNGQLFYKNVDVAVSNTMTTPKGGQYKLILADGTKVWLNAASSITYPTAFTSNSREVTITGEAYFEVAKNVSKPFIVKTARETIWVLGTSFNVNAYADEKATKTSLAEGSIKVIPAKTTGGEEKILQPGQAYINGKIITTDISQDISWKNGVFNFDNKKIQEAMRQLARWYDLEVVYQNGKIPDIEFGGKMGMDLKLSQMLKGLEGSGLQFRIERGNKLIITQ